MDISAFNIFLEGAQKFNDGAEQNYGNQVVETTTSSTNFPYTVIREIRNVDNDIETSSIGFSITVFAKNKGDVTKTTIAREISALMDAYVKQTFGLTLKRVSYNVDDTYNKGSTCVIITTYTGTWLPFRKKFI